MNRILVLMSLTLCACSTAMSPQRGTQPASSTQSVARAHPSSPPPEQAAPGKASAAEDIGLNELNAMTFACSKVGLNAAAREAAKAPARGRYQFSFFRLVSNAHHSSYEVHFKSNNYEDPDLKYCISVYCQQGWDPKAASPTVSLMGKAARSTKADAPGADHAVECGEHHAQTQARHSRKR